jgi:hypothetical protein
MESDAPRDWESHVLQCSDPYDRQDAEFSKPFSCGSNVSSGFMQRLQVQPPFYGSKALIDSAKEMKLCCSRAAGDLDGLAVTNFY